LTAGTVTHDDESAAIALRSVRPDDRAFLLSVYASTREPELATVVDWDAGQKAAFDVILVGGQPAGRLYLHRRNDEIRIMDIALLPQFCNRGIGTTLLKDLQAEAAAARKPLRIHVERFNPALRLYRRLAFRQIEDKGVYLFLEWRPDAARIT
jgi:ribosomal protein S18 acetylase RimI-like enzyme